MTADIKAQWTLGGKPRNNDAVHVNTYANISFLWSGRERLQTESTADRTHNCRYHPTITAKQGIAVMNS